MYISRIVYDGCYSFQDTDGQGSCLPNALFRHQKPLKNANLGHYFGRCFRGSAAVFCAEY